MIVGFGLDQMGRVPIGEASTRMLLYAWLLVAIRPLRPSSPACCWRLRHGASPVIGWRAGCGSLPNG